MEIRCDLHIHSLLSPCGSLEMSPKAIVSKAVSSGLDMIALTDHNSALNSLPFESACRSSGIHPLFGMELTCSEEFHCLTLFDDPQIALELGELLYPFLISGLNIPEKFGDQVYVDNKENICGEVEKYLTGGGLSLSSEKLITMVHERGGLFIPAHIDRAAFSISSQLGFIPPDPYDLLEIVSYPPPLDTGNFPLICNSDAHYLDDIGRRSFTLRCEDLNFSSIKNCLLRDQISLSIK